MSRAIWKDLDGYIAKKRSDRKRKLKDRAIRLKRKVHKQASEIRDLVNLRRLGFSRRDIDLLNKNIKDTFVIHKDKSMISKLHKKVSKYMKDKKEEKLQKETECRADDIRCQVEEEDKRRREAKRLAEKEKEDEGKVSR